MFSKSMHKNVIGKLSGLTKNFKKKVFINNRKDKSSVEYSNNKTVHGYEKKLTIASSKITATFH